MRILLTNDDGFDAPGLQALYQSLKQKHEVWIVAPEKEMSASSHALSLHKPICVKEKAAKQYLCNGTPVDCVVIALNCLVKQQIDLIISGINNGQNLGTDIIYSGTVAAARQGALLKKPSLAVSLSRGEGGYNFSAPAQFIGENTETFFKMWSEDHFLNINFPHNCSFPMQTAITFPSRRTYKDKYFSFNIPNGDLYFYIQGNGADAYNEEGSDFYTISRGKVSLSPIFIHPFNHKIENKYKNVNFWKGRNR